MMGHNVGDDVAPRSSSLCPALDERHFDRRKGIVPCNEDPVQTIPRATVPVCATGTA